jgi:hypothetical protein
MSRGTHGEDDKYEYLQKYGRKFSSEEAAWDILV